LAGLLDQQFGVQTQVNPGGRGEFSVWLDGEKIAEKDRDGFPTEQEVVSKVGQLISG
jgi:predicted Rdx family selenoprotein